MNVRVVTDSTAYLTPGVTQELNITVVPFHVELDKKEYLDGVNLDQEMFQRLVYDQRIHPYTSAPTVEEFYRVYDDLNQETGEIISIHLAKTLSAAVDNARQAADALLGRCQIAVLNSKTVSLGLGILVEAAARAAAEGQSLDEVVRLVRGMIPQIYVVFFSESLAYLERGGRIGHAQALLGTFLGIKPFLTLEEGEIVPIEKVRTREEAIEKLVEFVVEFDAVERLAIVKANTRSTEETDVLVERLQGTFPDLEVPILSYGSVLSSHIGPDTLGIIVHESFQV
jgi:DegV family protein with EDD domain